MGLNSIFGHERQKNLLLSFLHNERLPHAFLFAGQDGIGKKRLAIEFIKHILCEKGNGCGACRACLNVERLSHPDFLYVEPREKKADDDPDSFEDGKKSSLTARSYIPRSLIAGDKDGKVRGINQEVLAYPYEGSKRAILINDADRMRKDAADALLKTLEEPPPYNIFFLITSSEKEIPLTIRSRCIRIVFSPLQKIHIEQYFREVLNVDEKKARLLSNISYGSIGNGQFWMKESNLLLRRKLAELVTGKSRSFLNATLISEQVTGTSGDLSMYLSFLLSLLRDMYVVREQKDAAMVVNKDVRELLDWEKVDTKWVEVAVKKVQETISIMRYNVNRWLLFENLLIQIMR
jgi:DNA polymerase III subunit delta'